MKSLRAKELRNLTLEELQDKYRNLQEELFELRFQAKSDKLEKPSRISEIRRELARIKTITRELENAEAKR